MDAEEYFEKYQHFSSVSDIPEETKLGQLLRKMRDRHAILVRQQGVVTEALAHKEPADETQEENEVLRTMKEDIKAKMANARGTAFEQAE